VGERPGTEKGISGGEKVVVTVKTRPYVTRASIVTQNKHLAPFYGK